MAELVTMNEARAHLRIDSDADDEWLQIWIPAIGDAVLSWLKNSWRLYAQLKDADGVVQMDGNGVPLPLLDANGAPVVNPRVKSAALVELAQQYRFRDGSDAGVVPSHAGHGYVLGAGATALLSGARKSTVI